MSADPVREVNLLKEIPHLVIVWKLRLPLCDGFSCLLESLRL
jgi:hypothetical protein